MQSSSAQQESHEFHSWEDVKKKTKVNEGEIPQYYVEGDHEAIITPETFDMVQRELEKRGRGKKYRTGVRTFSVKIRCGECGCFYGSKTWHSTDKYRKEIWRCKHKYDGDKKCSTPALTDDEIKAAFLSAANKLLATKAEVIANGREMQEILFNTGENARTALEQTAYQKRYDELATRYDKLKQEIDSLSEKIHDTQSRKGSVEDFLRAFEKTPDSLPEFSLDAFTGLVDHLTVYAKDDIRVTSRNGQEVNA